MIKTKTAAIIFIGLILSSLVFATSNDGDFTQNVDERHFSIQLEELEASGIHFVAGIPIPKNNIEVHIFEK